MEITKTDLEQYKKQAGIVWTAATAKIAQARMDIARWIDIDNKDCKLRRMTWIGINIADAERKHKKIDTACRKLAEAKPSEAPTLYSEITTAYEELADSIEQVDCLLKAE